MKYFRYSFGLVVLLVIVLISMPVSAQDGGSRVQQGAAFMAANNIPPAAYVELSAYIGSDNQKTAEVLMKYGYTAEQAQAFMTPQNIITMQNVLNPGISDGVLAQAYALIAPYGLSATDLEALLPKLTDPAAMMAELMQKGLTQEQATQLLQTAAPVIQEAATNGSLQYVAMSKQLEATMGQVGVPSTMLFEGAHLLNDPERAAAYLAGVGYKPEQVEKFVAMIPGLTAQGITPELVEGFTIKNMIYRLEGMGLSPQAISEVVALGSVDAVRDYLTAQGLSGDALELALTNVQGVMGPNGEVLSPERLEAFQAKEANNLLSAAGIDPANLGEIMALSSDPAALASYLAEQGLDEAQIASFTTGLAQSSFAKTIDPDDADDFIGSVQAAAEGAYDDPAFFDSSNAEIMEKATAAIEANSGEADDSDSVDDDDDMDDDDSIDDAVDDNGDDSVDDSGDDGVSDDSGGDSGVSDDSGDDAGSSDAGSGDAGGGDSGGESGGEGGGE